MKMNLFLLGAVIVGGLVFFPDETRGVAWKTVSVAGDIAAGAAANAIVSVEDRVEERRRHDRTGYSADEEFSHRNNTEWNADGRERDHREDFELRRNTEFDARRGIDSACSGRNNFFVDSRY